VSARPPRTGYVRSPTQRVIRILPVLWALANEAELRRSVEEFIRGPRSLDAFFEPELGLVRGVLDDQRRATGLLHNEAAMSRLVRDCGHYHHALAGTWGDILRARERMIDRVDAALGEGKVSASQIEAAIEGRPAVAADGSSYFPPLALGHVAAQDGSDLISRWSKEKGIRPRGVYQSRLDMAKFVAVIGHDEATRVTPLDIVHFKEHLAEKGLSAPTISRYLSAIKSPLGWAHRNHKIGTNPGLGITYEAKEQGRRKVRRLGYDNRQARIILLAARDETRPSLRWVPWVCAFTGCRLDEVAGRDACDIKRTGSVWVLEIPEGKTDGSVRRVPLHSKLIVEGLLDYWRGLPAQGPLFPDLKDGRYGRAGTATKTIGRWLRSVQKETGVLLVEEPRFAPTHSWRHRFKSEARRLGPDGRPIMSEEVSDALTGHHEGRVSRDYGEYYVKEVLRPAIEAMISPFDLPDAEDASESEGEPE
jgi:integrase